MAATFPLAPTAMVRRGKRLFTGRGKSPFKIFAAHTAARVPASRRRQQFLELSKGNHQECVIPATLDADLSPKASSDWHKRDVFGMKPIGIDLCG